MRPFETIGQNLPVLIALSLIGLSHSLPLNFRFSPRFDYADRETNKHARAVAQHSKKHHAHSGAAHRYPAHRRYPRSVSVEDRLKFLKARLAALKDELASRQSKTVNQDIDSGIMFDKEDQHGKVDWPAKLHNKHIFSRTVQILGAFPKAFPEPPIYQVAAANAANAAALARKTNQDLGAVSADKKIIDDRRKLLDLKRKQQEDLERQQQQMQEEQEIHDKQERMRSFDQPRTHIVSDEMTDENVMTADTPF
ncbi:uncharacterized protein LOC129586695 [Paramacrobiotus metropolitanus]|uniref:uncharacterized protein LOC129586695 n=1 Tax=Paramacrobiotus metropolitanus TaxID=2943436 RepID=UPI0024456E35|nr:uncharacterized protein LOC129586695 [Paramacrobiotus metropolitanus]